MATLHLTVTIINIISIPITLAMCMFCVTRWDVGKSKTIAHDANSVLITNMAPTQQGRHRKVLYCGDRISSTKWRNVKLIHDVHRNQWSWWGVWGRSCNIWINKIIKKSYSWVDSLIKALQVIKRGCIFWTLWFPVGSSRRKFSILYPMVWVCLARLACSRSWPKLTSFVSLGSGGCLWDIFQKRSFNLESNKNASAKRTTKYKLFSYLFSM